MQRNFMISGDIVTLVYKGVEMKKSDIKKLLASMKCAECSREFQDNSFTIMRQEDGLFVLQIKSRKCQKGFGMAFLGLEKDELLDVINEDFAVAPEVESDAEDVKAIDYDDILDAHEFIQNLDENWKRFVAAKNKKL